MGKETFGYPTRTAAIWALVEQRESLEDIAGKLGLFAADVRVYLGYKRGRFFPKKPGRYLVDAEGGLHPCASTSLAAIGAVTIRPIAANETTTADVTTADRAGACEGRAPEGSSGAAVAACEPPAIVRQPRTSTAKIAPAPRLDMIREVAKRLNARLEAEAKAGRRPKRAPVKFAHTDFDDFDAAPTAFCGQCDKRRTREQAAACESPFCLLQERADA